MLWEGQTKSNEGFLDQLEKAFPLVLEGDGAVVGALRTEHCFVTCDAVLIFFAVAKTTVNYFLKIGIQNLESSSLPLSGVRTVC